MHENANLAFQVRDNTVTIPVHYKQMSLSLFYTRLPVVLLNINDCAISYLYVVFQNLLNFSLSSNYKKWLVVLLVI